MKLYSKSLLVVLLSFGSAASAGAASATWNGGAAGTTWNSAANWTPVAVPNSTTAADVLFNSTISALPTSPISLGTSIGVDSLTVSGGTGGLTINDASNTLTFGSGANNSTDAINVSSGQSLTLNVNTSFAANTTIAVSGATTTLGAGYNVATGTSKITITGSNGTVAFNGTTTGSGTIANQGAIVDLGSNMNNRIQLGATPSTSSRIASLYITADGVTDFGALSVLGGDTAGTTSKSVFTFGANIAGGGTATYNSTLALTPTSGTAYNSTVILSANQGSTVNFNGQISGSSTATLLLQISGGGTVALNGNAANTFATAAQANGTEVLGNTNLQLNNSAGTALTSNTTVDAGSAIQLKGTNQIASTAVVTINGAGGSSGATGALENISGNNSLASGVAVATASTISSDTAGNALTLTGGISNGSTLTVTGAGDTAVSTAGITGTGGVSKTGTGSLFLNTANNYSGGTIISGGTVYVNGGAVASSSGTGTGSVVVQSGGTLAGNGVVAPTGGGPGVTISSGGGLSSGGVQVSDATHGAVTGPGLTIDNTEASASALTVNGGATLTFALGTGASTGGLSFSTPNTNSTFLTLSGSTVDQIFSSTTTVTNIDLVDLTANLPSAGPANTLQLRYQNPYLLIVTTPTGANANADFANLYTTGGEGANGYVLGVSDGTATGYTPFSLEVTNLAGTRIDSATNYGGLQLYLYNGELEVIPEPGTWALMLGGLGVLVFFQRRRSNS